MAEMTRDTLTIHFCYDTRALVPQQAADSVLDVVCWHFYIAKANSAVVLTEVGVN